MSRRLRQTGAVALLALVVLAASGCSPTESTAAASPVKRPVLRLGYTPSEETVADREESNQALAGYLGRALNVDVQLVRTASYGPAIEALSHGEIDLIGLGPLAYVLAARRGIAEAIVVTGREPGGPRTYQSALVTHRRTGLQTLDDVVARRSSLRFNYTDTASNSGHLVPQARLQSLGLVPDRDFASTDFTLSHSVALFNVAFGKADLAGVSNSVFERLTAKGRLPADDLVVLWRSERLPLGPIVVRSALDPALKRALREAIVALRDREPATAAEVMAQYPEKGLVYLPGDDSLYDGLRALATAVRDGTAQP